VNVTLKDIANKLGISHSTVSLALNNSPKVAEATREKILLTAKEMGYKASPYVSALMAARRKGKDPKDAPTVALVTPNRTPDYWKNRHHLRRFISGCTATAQSLGIRTELFWIGEKNMSAKRMNDILYNRGISGAVLLTHGVWGDRLDHCWEDLATVTYGVRALDPDTDWVGADFYGNMERTIGILQRYGFNRIGFIMDIPFPYQHHNRWLAAYMMHQKLIGSSALEPWVDQEPSFEGFSRWFNKEKPEVIICVRPANIIEWLVRLDFHVPEDVGVVAIGTAEKGGEISGIVENTRTCGKLAMEMLLDRIHRGQFGLFPDPQHIVISGEWNAGRTVRQS
jgi:LacI family transcriptional regulator